MRALKRIAGAVIAAALMVSMAICASAANDLSSGTLTITPAANVSLEGKSFQAYRILDATRSKTSVAYTVPESMKAFYKAEFGIPDSEKNFDTAVAAKIAALTTADSLNAFAAKALAYAKDTEKGNITPVAGIAAKDTQGKVTEVNFSDIPYGYYVIEDTTAASKDSVISALMLQTPTAKVAMKADKPSLDKNIEEGNTKVKHNTAAIGDTVAFRLDSSVPNMTGYTKYYYVVKDTLSEGLTFQKDVAVTIGGKTADFTLDFDEKTNSFEIAVKDFIQYKNKAGAPIVITYHAVVNEKAKTDNTGNDNTAKLIYSNNPNEDVKPDDENDDKPKPGTVIGETPETKTTTYVTKLILTKTDDASKPLAGAKFKLTGTKLNKVYTGEEEVFVEAADGAYYQLNDKSYTMELPIEDEHADGYNADQYVKNTDGSYKKFKKTTKPILYTVPQDDKSITLTTGEDGILSFSGLNEGTYTIEETEAPAGYNKIVGTFTFSVKLVQDEDEEHNKIANAYHWEVTNEENAEIKISSDGTDLRTTVVNKTGSQLPSTGGIGTMVFTVTGALIVIAGAAAFIIRKRRA